MTKYMTFEKCSRSHGSSRPRRSRRRCPSACAIAPSRYQSTTAASAGAHRPDGELKSADQAGTRKARPFVFSALPHPMTRLAWPPGLHFPLAVENIFLGDVSGMRERRVVRCKARKARRPRRTLGSCGSRVRRATQQMNRRRPRIKRTDDGAARPFRDHRFRGLTAAASHARDRWLRPFVTGRAPAAATTRCTG